MTSRNYIPQHGDILNKIRLYHNNFPRKIKIIKITRSGHVHYKDANGITTRQDTMTLNTLRKCFNLDVTSGVYDSDTENG